jgi:hypothetical protein
VATLDLDQAPRAAVYRKLVELIRNDPTIRRIFRPTSIRAWDGKPQDSAPFDTTIAPCLRITPSNGPDEWLYPEAFAGDLYLNVELVVRGTDCDDVFNVWFAIQRAIYPRDFTAKTANVTALQQAGAKTGLAQFSLPAFDPNPSDNYFAAAGQIKISVREQLSV